jgi:phosphatidyl-myo-inositol dimannoside synthase
MDPSSFSVLTASSDPRAAEFDAEQRRAGIRIERVQARMLLPTPRTIRRVETSARSAGASLVVLDPAVPLGLIGRLVRIPYAVVVHGAEVTVPGRMPLSRSALSAVLAGARLIVCAGGYPAAEACRALGSRRVDMVEVPPGVDTQRFRPFRESERITARAELGLPEQSTIVLSVSRLVPRKGMDVLIEASAALKRSFPELVVAIAGEGRDRARLERLARHTSAPVTFLGRVGDEVLPALYGAADLFVMACRNRWGGLEQEGFGIVFLEAAAAGVAQIAGRSGGAHEAVIHEETGLVVGEPSDPSKVASALRRLLTDDALRTKMGEAARARAESSFGYDQLSRRLADALASVPG